MDNYRRFRYAIVLHYRGCTIMPHYRFLRTHEDAGENGYCIAHVTDQGQWRCENPSCNFLNSTYHDFCGFCGANREGDPPVEYGVDTTED